MVAFPFGRWITSIEAKLKGSFDHEMNRLLIEIDWMHFANEHPDLAELLVCDPKRFTSLSRNQLLLLWKDEPISFETLRFWVRPFGIPFVGLTQEQQYQTKSLTRFHGKVCSHPQILDVAMQK